MAAIQDEIPAEHRDLLNKLLNFMKIADMDKYGIKIFEAVLDKNMGLLSEKDFVHLISSYWCNVQHLRTMIKRRGLQIKESTLKLEMTQQLLHVVVDCGPNIKKMKFMLEQRRRDLGYNKTEIVKAEKNFLSRYCRQRFWNYDIPIQALHQNRWLTPGT